MCFVFARASILASQEVRKPWLDQRIAEFASRKVPDVYWAIAQ